MKGFSSLEDFAKEIFTEDVTEEEFKAVYTRCGVFIDELPFSAQTQVWRANSLFYKDDQRFKVEIDLAKSHIIENSDELTKEDMKIIKPVFANAYLQKAGIAPTEEAIRKFHNMVDITKDNVQINTRKKGYAKEQIIIKERPDEYFNSIKAKVNVSDKKFDTIRANIRAAWSEMEEFFPRELPVYKSKPYVPTADFISLRMIDEQNKPAARCPSSLPKRRKIDPKVKNPFIMVWPLAVTKDEVEAVIELFIEKFDFKKNFKLNNQQIAYIKGGALTIGFVPRLFYHCAKYIYSIFILNEEDLHDYIRIRAIWLILTAKYNEDDIIYLSPILVLLKVCIVLLLNRNAPKDAIENSKDMEATVFNFIDKMMNPYKIYDPMTEEPRTLHAPKLVKIPEGRSLQDIIELVNCNCLDAFDTIIAKTMLSFKAPMELTQLLNTESWGDLEDTNEEDEVEKDESLSLPIQKMIQQDIAELNWLVPHPVSDWIKPEGAAKSPPLSSANIASPYSLTTPTTAQSSYAYSINSSRLNYSHLRGKSSARSKRRDSSSSGFM